MQEAVGTMKSHTFSQDGLDCNRRWSGRWGLNVTGRKSQAVEISVQRIARPTVADIKTQSFSYLKTAANLAELAPSLTGSKRLTGLSKPRQTISIALPPISGSRAILGKVLRPDGRPANRLGSAKSKGHKTLLATSKMMTENEALQSKMVSQGSAAGNKADIQDPESHSRLIRQTSDSQPASTSAPADPPARQKNDAGEPGANDRGRMVPVRAKHDASLCKTRQQRDFCSDDSAIETESEGSSDKGRPERPKDDSEDDYYTDQRITEWVLKVNSSLFSAGNDELKQTEPTEEQDVATIKVYYGD